MYGVSEGLLLLFSNCTAVTMVLRCSDFPLPCSQKLGETFLDLNLVTVFTVAKFYFHCIPVLSLVTEIIQTQGVVVIYKL